jgi:hypothetical protein
LSFEVRKIIAEQIIINATSEVTRKLRKPLERTNAELRGGVDMGEGIILSPKKPIDEIIMTTDIIK